jgi:hypothetical protein
MPIPSSSYPLCCISLQKPAEEHVVVCVLLMVCLLGHVLGLWSIIQPSDASIA